MRLTPHPSTPLPAGWQLTAQCMATAAAVQLLWRLRADLERICWPPPRSPTRCDGLWRHTCFELFVADPHGEGYREFNFSPSSEWAAYGFTRYREGRTELELAEAPQMLCVASADELVLTVTMPRTALGALPGPRPTARRVGLAAVIERAADGFAYLALAHPDGHPDFHHPAGFAAEFSL